MRICPECGREYDDSLSGCPDCEPGLLGGQSNDLDLPDGEAPFLLCKTSDMAGAELLAESLRQENIPFLMNPGILEFRMIPLEYGQRGIRIYVPRQAAARARDLAMLLLSDFGEKEGNQ